MPGPSEELDPDLVRSSRARGRLTVLINIHDRNGALVPKAMGAVSRATNCATVGSPPVTASLTEVLTQLELSL